MPRVTKANAREHLQSALDVFTKVTGEAVGATFTWNGKMYVIGTNSFKEYAEKNQNKIWNSLISSVHRPSQASPLSKPVNDRDFSELFTKEYQKLYVSTLRCMVRWITAIDR